MNENEIDFMIENYVDDVHCNLCGSLVLLSAIDEYKYQCVYCDVDLFEFETSKETHTQKEKIRFTLQNFIRVTEW